MSIRDQIQNPAVGITVAVIGLAAATLFTLIGGGETIEVKKAIYFYDLDTKTLYGIATTDHPVPPVVAPSGGEGVRAKVYSCGNCDDESKYFVGLLEKYSDKAKKAIEEKSENADDLRSQGLLVSLPDGQKWESANDDEGSKIIVGSRRGKCPDGVKLIKCEPRLNPS